MILLHFLKILPSCLSPTSTTGVPEKLESLTNEDEFPTAQDVFLSNF